MQSIKTQLEQMNMVRNFVDDLYQGELEAFTIIYYIKNNYREWAAMLQWLQKNGLRGKNLVNFFKHESPDNSGYLMGCTHILSRMKGHKNNLVGVKINELS